MKKFKIFSKISAFILSAALLFGAVSCTNDLTAKDGSSDSSRAVTLTDLNRSVDITFVLLGVPSGNAKPGVWAWAENGDADVEYTAKSWPGDMAMTAETISGYSCYTYTLKVDPSYPLGILFNNISGGSPQTNDIEIPKEKIATATTYYFNWNSMAYYEKIDDCIGIFGASITKLDTTTNTATVKLTTSLLTSIARANLTIKDSAGNALKIDGTTDIAITSDSATLTLLNDSSTDSSVTKVPYIVTYNSKDTTASIDMSLIENLYGTKAKDVEGLGLTLTGTNATFKTWAPTATKVNVLLYADSAAAYDASKTADYDQGSTEKDFGTAPTGDAVKPMTLDLSTGVWTLENVNVSGYKYYKYQITVAGTTYYVSDIWHTVAGPDSCASQIATIDDADATPSSWETTYTNPFGSSGSEIKKYNDAVIYEMHIRDWSRAFNPTSTGKFKDITDALGTNGNGDFGKHLKDLGVTHVQILPMFDYAQLNSNEKYNWGYNPYHYNVPEGRYVTEGYTDGTQAVKEAREMIKAFHDAGISVIMDVVYNHTSATSKGSLYDSTVPGYFYRQSSDGSYSNGSGCGNETASDRTMVQKYMIESLKHWVKDYHVNGFRFDLMGVHDKDTMKAIYDALYSLDKNILVYGEPWNGGTSSLTSSSQTTSAGKGSAGYGYGAFDDDYRDAIKGAEFGGFNRGQVQGSYADANLILGLKGATITKNKRNETGITGLALHYAECHDNYTLFDKLVYSTDSSISGDGSFAPKFADLYKSVMNDKSKLDLIKKENKLAAAYVLLGQGTPFLNGGQEFMRTKKGDPDSYAADTKGGITWTNEAGDYNIDDVNTIDLSLKTKFSDVYNVYKGLIHLRKDFKAFTDPTSVDASTLSDGVTKYTADASDGSFTVVFNATDKGITLTDALEGNIVDVESRLKTTGNYLGFGFADVDVDVDVDVEPYKVYSEKSSVTSVPAKSFVIVKK